MVEYKITLTDSLDPADVDVVRKGLDTHNTSQSAVVDWVPLALFAREADDIIIAGLTGSTYWGYLYVGRLWTDQRLRQAGLGSKLLAPTEAAKPIRLSISHSHEFRSGKAW